MKNNSVTIESDFWIGIVEDNSSDPLKIGQCKVRIIALHSFDATELPTEELPWAIPSISMNGSKSFSVPNVNDWVYGHFLDGVNKQKPVIIGILPGLINPTTYVKLTGEQQREYLQKLQAQAKPSTEPDPGAGQPTTPAISRGDVENTSIATTNSNLVASCHIASEVNKLMNLAKIETGQLVAAIREAIVNLLQSTGAISPAVEGLKQTFAYVAEKLNMINGILEDIIEPIQKVIQSVAEIRAVIEYILSLPDRLRVYLEKCLNDLYAALSKGAFEIISEAISEATDFDTSSLPTEEALSILNETQKLLENAAFIAAAPAQIADALLSPSNLTPEQQRELTSQMFPNVVEFENNIYKTI
jgi:hypothetical protein